MGLVRAGQGELVRDAEGRRIEILARTPGLTVTWSRYPPGAEGPAPHFHRTHTDAFYVLQGELRFRVGPQLEPVQLKPGMFLAVPPGVVHGFDNGAGATAVFLNFHAPDGGFGASLRGDPGAFDSEDAPEGGGAPADQLVLRAPDDSRAIEVGGSELLLMAGADDAVGQLAVNRSTLAPGFPGPPPHRHRRTTDSFYVLEGRVTLTLGAERVEAHPGDFVVVEPGTVHTFGNASEEPAHLLNAMAPGELARYFAELGEALTGGRAVTQEAIGRIASRHDFEPAG